MWEISARDLVAGDVMLLEAGNVVTAVSMAVAAVPEGLPAVVW